MHDSAYISYLNSEIHRIKIVRMSIIPYRLNEICIKILMGLLKKLEQIIAAAKQRMEQLSVVDYSSYAAAA